MGEKTFVIYGTDKTRDEQGFRMRRYACGEIKSTSPHKALYRWLKANGLKRVDVTETGHYVTETTYEAREKNK